MKNIKSNVVILGGNIAQIDLTNGQYGVFGTVTLAIDDGYFKKGENGQDGQWIDRTHFAEVKVNANNLKSIKVQLEKGDQLQIQGKLVQEKWTDSQTGQNRSAMKVDCQSIVCHVPKALIELGKQSGVIPTANQNQQQPQNAQNQQNGQRGGFQQMPSNRQQSGYPAQGGYGNQ